MQRQCFSFLEDWLNSDDRKPLVIRGARQVGKTWIVRHLAATSQKKLIEVNLEKDPKLASLFLSNEPKVIIEKLQVSFNTTIDPLGSILFIDEIQEKPEIFAKLRWFAEDMKELPVIAAGSLLEFMLGEHTMSMPVGRIGYLYLEPLSFEEFLAAQNKHQLLKYIQNYSWQEEIPEYIHDTLISLLKEYIIIGGMPEAAANWSAKRSFKEVGKIHHAILKTYRDDFNKYSQRISSERLYEVLTAIPRFLGKKFVYSAVTQIPPYTATKEALKLLSQSRVCHIVKGVAANGLPLAAEPLDHYFKVIFIDVGLCSAELGLSLAELDSVEEIDLINKGGIAEQLAGQLLRTIFPFYQEPALYYWVSTNTHTSAEIDYVIQHGSKVIPLEIKAGKSGTLKSLHRFMHIKEYPLAVRINSAVPSINHINLKDTQSNLVVYELRSIPFYLLGQLHRLLS
jgi:hypothetical protein